MLNNYITKALFKFLQQNEEARDNMLACVKHIHDLEMTVLSIPREDYYNAFLASA